MLVARILALLTTGKTTLGRVVAVTFTEKAAGEMKLRLRGEIEHARRGRPLTRGPPSALTSPWRSSKRHVSAPSTGSAPTSCASAPSKRGSTRS